MSNEEVYKELTLDDIETAIAILKHFIKMSRKADILLRQLNRYQRTTYSSGNIFDVNSIVRTLLEQRGQIKPAEENIGELTPEEVQRMKEVVNKIKKKPKP